MSCVKCHMSRVMVMCHMSRVTCHIFFKVVKLVCGGSVINGATPSSLFIYSNAVCRTKKTVGFSHCLLSGVKLAKFVL